ncbi:MAG: metallophosphoesterase [Solirubrobacteraceae bacterium]|nr:metallophosphoesterase [Solirubrobacteraceae bacterium]
MRTLVISDLHLGSRVGRDVLRRPAVLERLCAVLPDMDRLVLLGDTIEMLEGRPAGALADAEPVLRAIGTALGPGREVVLLPGNHDHSLVLPWIRERRAAGTSIGTSGRVPLRSNPDLQTIARFLRPARLQVRYPGVDLGDGIWAHHGHYLDRHLVRQPPSSAKPSTPEEYEGALTASIARIGAGLAAAMPPAFADAAERALGLLRLADVVARPFVAALPGSGLLAPLSAGALGYQFRRAGLPAMAAVSARLEVSAEHVLFGHVHRSGPRDHDDPDEWTRGGQRLWNSGCWVYEPLLLAGASPPHPYWPGGALTIDHGVIRSVGLLDDLDPEELRTPLRRLQPS